MSKFILVHDVNEAKPIIINTDDIHYIEKNEEYTGASFICTNEADFDVVETPEKIYEMLK
ncbi:MAG: hypothetical protein IKY26_05985 [Erysipelotrichaceae bacterium]|nr:hypothetical protein [Erysipelotrichaceae bacterium]